MVRHGVCLNLIVAGVLSGSWVAAAAQEAPPSQDSSVLQSLSTMEERAGLSPAPGRSLFERASALEMRIFGTTRKGSLVDRVGELNRALTPGGAAPAPSDPAPASPDQSGAAPRQQGFAAKSVFNAAAVWPPASLSPPKFVRIDPPGGALKAAGDYYPEVMKATKNKIFRFKTMPIPVYITPYQERSFTAACIAGFEDWEQRTDEEIRFVQVGSPDQARIRVVWTHLGLNSDPKGCTLGAHTTLTWKSRPKGSVSVVSMGVVPVPIYIPTVGPKYSVPPQVIEVNLTLVLSRSPEVRFALLENIVAHELGHALGLLGHSPHKTDLMFPMTDEHSRLSVRDINTVLRVYRQKVEVPL